MKMNHLNRDLSGLALVLLLAGSRAEAQIYHPTNWMNDPYCSNANYGLRGAGSDSPSFTNNGIQRGSLYVNSPIGTVLTLKKPGDRITLQGQVSITGDVNVNGDMQFRAGLYQQGESTNDMNWLGYMFGNPAGSGLGAGTGIFIRKNPNASAYASASLANASRPECVLGKYNSGWGAGTYDFTLSVTLQQDQSHDIEWSLTGISPSAYGYSASYKNTRPQTRPALFDQVGFLAGAALFKSASTNNCVVFKDITVSFSRAGQTP